jgi:alkylation response protein AidB-like acyl-CoA dehydrogenase
MVNSSFLLSPAGAAPIFTPEQLTSDQKALGQTTHDFVEKEVSPLNDKIESKEKGVMPGLLKKAGEIGLLMAEIPETNGGLGLGKIEATVIAENSTAQGSFQVAIMCHTGIGTLPIIYWGTDLQKQKYLPRLATGEILSAYALTEANAGSDALAGRTTAVLSKDGKKYILNGEKVFITNGGFADIYTIFAKVDGKYTAFLVERGFKGLSTGPEEKKMGIHGSSTVPVIMQDVEVPVENLLGELGKGHKIAFNTLNVGRWKLGACCMGACKRLITISARYAVDRVQFGHPIASFELIGEKIADCAIRTYLLESLIYRYAGQLDEAHKQAKDQAEKVKQLESLAVEASIAKVFGSEALDFVADESVQIHGGYGYCDEYNVERFYRDSRINRIFEGTNEINRLALVGTLIKRSMAGEVDFGTELGNILGWLKAGFPKRDEKLPLAVWLDAVDQLKRLAIYTLGVGIQKYADKITEHQGLMAGAADMIIDAYACDSGITRALRSNDPIHANMACTYIAERLPVLKAVARQLLANVAQGEQKEFASYEKAIDRIVPQVLFDTRSARARISGKILTV